MIHEMKLKEVYFNKIKLGEKKFEIRLNDDKRKLITVGDDILFKNNENLKDFLTVKVEDLLYFKSFSEMLQSLPLKEIGFENKNIKQIEEIYHSFYTKEDEKKFGVLAIKIKV